MKKPVGWTSFSNSILVFYIALIRSTPIYYDITGK